MAARNLFKAPEILALNDPTGDGLTLLHWQTKRSLRLNGHLARSWEQWDADISLLALPAAQQGFDDFVINGDLHQQLQPSEFDNLVPVIRTDRVKWHAESADLHILFNSQPMTANNPLLALGPYGSLCWKGVVYNWSIGRIRAESMRVFGQDEALPFIKRLSELGFIQPIRELADRPLAKEKICKEFPAPDVQAQLFHARIPWYCLWEVTYNCDLECRTCYLPETTDKVPNKERAAQIAQQVIDAGIFYVCLLGGEPLLREDLEAIIDQLRQAGVFVKVISNGQKLTPLRARSLAAAGLNQIEISFDGLCRQSHDLSRGVGTFDKAIEALHNARQAQLPRVGMVWTVHAENIAESEQLPRFMARHQLRECYLSPFKKTGPKARSAELSPLLPVAVDELQKKITAWGKNFPDLTIALPGNCSCGRTSIVIGENAEVRSCSFAAASNGNTQTTALTDIWNSIKNRLPETGPYGFCQEK